jgi:hypothetical protein
MTYFYQKLMQKNSEAWALSPESICAMSLSVNEVISAWILSLIPRQPDKQAFCYHSLTIPTCCHLQTSKFCIARNSTLLVPKPLPELIGNPNFFLAA